jgi:uncharacterized protein YkwD
MVAAAAPRTMIRALHVTVMAVAVGLAAVACAPAGIPTAAMALTGATDVVVDANPTTTDPTTTTTPAPAAASTTSTSAVAAAPGTVAPVVAAVPDRAQPAPPTGAARSVTAAAPVVVLAPAPAPLAVVVPVAAPAAAPAGDGVAVQAARAVFDATNAFRRQNGVAPLVWSDALQRSAHQHDLAMAAANQMSHQLPGEASFDTRIGEQGVPWLSVGENVGFNTVRTVAGALALHTMMINEVAPNDDHKVNKLDPKFSELGVDVYLDTATGKLWLTEDYAQI